MLTDRNGLVAMHGDGTGGGDLTKCGELGQRLSGADGSRTSDQHSFVRKQGDDGRVITERDGVLEQGLRLLGRCANISGRQAVALYERKRGREVDVAAVVSGHLGELFRFRFTGDSRE